MMPPGAPPPRVVGAVDDNRRLHDSIEPRTTHSRPMTMRIRHSLTTSTNAAPCVLILAGLDPSGGAGISADQRAIHSTGAWPCPVLSVITVQSTAGLVDVSAVDPSLVLAQAREVLRHQRVQAIKTGALGAATNVRAIVELLDEHTRVPLVVDPVIVATRSAGARLLDSDAGEALAQLMARATVVTPNVDEAEEILGTRIRTEEELVNAAFALQRLGPRAVLLKGGHLQGTHAVDVLVIGDKLRRLSARRLPVAPFHGGGCTMASLVAGYLALAPRTRGRVSDEAIVDAARLAKRKLGQAIRRAVNIGHGLRVLPL